MDCSRIILNFDKDIYNGQNKVWYILNCNITPTVDDLLRDITEKFKCFLSWNLYINDIIAPPWIPTKLLCPGVDNFKLICTEDCQTYSRSSITDQIINDESAKQEEKSVLLNSDMIIDVSDTLCQNDAQKPLLKINNNFKRKLEGTTPIHRDRYTNRSKIYISPGAKKDDKISSIPVVTALKSAVKETVIGFTMPDHGDNNPSLKTNVFKDRVNSLLEEGNLKQKVEMSSDSDSSMTSDESNDEKDVKRAKLIIHENSKCSDKSSDKEAFSASPLSENNSRLIANQTGPSKISKENCPNSPQKQPGIICGNPVPSISSSDSDSDIAKSNVVNIKASSTSCISNENSEESDENSNTCSEDRSSNELITVGKLDPCNKEQDTSIINIDKVMIRHSPDKCFTSSLVVKDYSSFINLQGTPRVSDKLAFKMLDLNESYCPVISEYKEGTITDYNSDTQCITIDLFPSFIAKMPQKNGRFELENDSKKCNSLLELNLKQLIEPKLL